MGKKSKDKAWKNDKIGRVFNEAAKKFDVPPSQVSEIFYCMFEDVSEVLKQDDFPIIRIPKIGVLEPSIRKIKNNLKRIEYAYQKYCYEDCDTKRCREMQAKINKYKRSLSRRIKEIKRQKENKKIRKNKFQNNKNSIIWE